MASSYVDEVYYGNGKVDRIESESLEEHIDKIELHLRDLLVDMVIRVAPVAIIAGGAAAVTWHLAGFAWAALVLLVCVVAAEEIFGIDIQIMLYSCERRDPWIQIYRKRLQRLDLKRQWKYRARQRVG